MKKTLVMVLIIQFLVYAGFGMVIPVLPEVVAGVSGRAGHIGGVLAVYSLASFLTSPAWGHLADRHGRRRILITGLAGYSAGFFLFGLYLDSLLMMYLSRVLSGVFAGALYAAAMSTISDISDDKTRNRNLGLVGMAIGVGFIIGPASGGLLSVFGYGVPFFLAGGILLLLIPVAWTNLDDASWVKVEAEPEQKWLPSLKLPSANLLKLLLLMSFSASFLLAGLESVFQIYGIDMINMTPAEMGMLFLISGIILAGVQGGLLRKVKTGTEYRWIILGQAASGLAFLFMALVFNLVLAAVYLILFVVGNAVIRTLSLSLITRASGERSGYASGLQFSADSMGRILGPLLFAFLYDLQGGSLFYIAAGFSFMIVLFIVLKRERLKVASVVLKD
ncbi:MFS transporter [Salipaludibacillus aurantiacus]|uniref:Predicted arabinose efflux permease, MFS family n=1 Tax=Salipaludibacillus aurantiacus TaxID=1601833 RepID=A0A1H9RSL6_9BACI|nr:MFS transporter [Salipaludibacillus aurantiacus]SER75445.1 Predicted arabinose efflux permease, MFS family [Salipaludibacillus aurantiacus]